MRLKSLETIYRMTIATFLLSAFSCAEGEGCQIPTDFSFEASSSEQEIESESSISFDFEFAPIPAQRMSFYSEQNEQVRLVSPTHEIEKGEAFILTRRNSEIVSDEYDSSNPLLIETLIHRFDEGSAIKLVVDNLGVIFAIPGDTVQLGLVLYPAKECLASSNEGYSSGYITLQLD